MSKIITSFEEFLKNKYKEELEEFYEGDFEQWSCDTFSEIKTYEYFELADEFFNQKSNG